MTADLTREDRFAIGDALALYIIEYRDHVRWYEGETRDADDILRIAHALGVIDELRDVLEARVHRREADFLQDVKLLRQQAVKAREVER